MNTIYKPSATQSQTYCFYPGCAYKAAAGYKMSVDTVNHHLGINFIEIENWKCCGATIAFSLNEDKALALTGKILASAVQQGFEEIITVCNACYSTLRKTAGLLKTRPDLRQRTNEILSQDKLQLETIPHIRHYLEVLVHDIPQNYWETAIINPDKARRIAAYYGCQLTRPQSDVDDPQRPTLLDRFIENIGFTPVAHSAKTLCCGAAHAVAYQQDCQQLTERIIQEVQRKQAQWITTICPLCQFNLDSLQNTKTSQPVPVLYFTQLLGLALGLPEKQLGLHKLIIPLTQ